MTQQNAALVEESAAAAESLKDQALRLAEVVASFRLTEGASVQRTVQPAVQPAAAKPASTPRPGPAKPVVVASAKPVERAKPAAKVEPRSEPKPAARPAPVAATTAPDGDWETF